MVGTRESMSLKFRRAMTFCYKAMSGVHQCKPAKEHLGQISVTGFFLVYTAEEVFVCHASSGCLFEVRRGCALQVVGAGRTAKMEPCLSRNEAPRKRITCLRSTTTLRTDVWTVETTSSTTADVCCQRFIVCQKSKLLAELYPTAVGTCWA